MRRDWDARAAEDARFFIATGAASSDEAFRESGKHDLEGAILCGVELDRDAEVLEIGCGIGRLLVPLSERVAVAHGVDISPAMIEQARSFSSVRSNVHLSATDGTLSGFPDASLDFVYSYIVFQHVPDRASIETYVREAARVLRPGGLLRFQVDGRWCAERKGSTTYDGVKFRPEEVRALVDGAGLHLVDSWGEETHYHSVLAARQGSEARAGALPRAWDVMMLRRLLERAGSASDEGTVRQIVEGRTSLRSALGALEDTETEDHATFLGRLHQRLFGFGPREEEVTAQVSLLSKGQEERSAIVDALVAGSGLRDRIAPVARPAPWFRREGVRDVIGDEADAPLFELLDALEERLSEFADRELFSWGFTNILGSVPDGQARAHYDSTLARGPDERRLFLRELLTTPGPASPAALSGERLEALLRRNSLASRKAAEVSGESFPGEALVAKEVLSLGRDLPHAAFVVKAYERVLGRPADEEGAAYYEGKLSRGEMSRPELVRELLWSGELRGA